MENAQDVPWNEPIRNREELGWRGAYEGGKMKEAGTAHWRAPTRVLLIYLAFLHCPAVTATFTVTYIGKLAAFWTTTEYNTNGWCRFLFYSNTTIYRSRYHKFNGYSIRCVKD